ncbi:MAG: hypothetical protein GC145_03215 [Caulobacter sp.]|nr:hypothetical protein [Caulobacter sp.]
MTGKGARAADFLAELQALQSTDGLRKIQRDFKTGAGDYSEGDRFIEVKMGALFKLSERHLEMSVAELESLRESDIHEARAGAISIMGQTARRCRHPTAVIPGLVPGTHRSAAARFGRGGAAAPPPSGWCKRIDGSWA